MNLLHFGRVWLSELAKIYTIWRRSQGRGQLIGGNWFLDKKLTQELTRHVFDGCNRGIAECERSIRNSVADGEFKWKKM
jgi:hypothetical protein